MGGQDILELATVGGRISCCHISSGPWCPFLIYIKLCGKSLTWPNPNLLPLLINCSQKRKKKLAKKGKGFFRSHHFVLRATRKVSGSNVYIKYLHKRSHIHTYIHTYVYPWTSAFCSCPICRKIWRNEILNHFKIFHYLSAHLCSLLFE